MVAGGWGRDRQRFDRTAASAQSSMLFLAAVAMAMPAIYELVEGKGLPSPGAERVAYGSTVEWLSFAVALVLIASYAAGLVFLAAHAPRPVQTRAMTRRRTASTASRGPCAAR